MGENEFYSKLEADGMHVVLSRDGNRRIPFGRTHAAKQNAEAVAALLSHDWCALSFAGYSPPAVGGMGADPGKVSTKLHEAAQSQMEDYFTNEATETSLHTTVRQLESQLADERAERVRLYHIIDKAKGDAAAASQTEQQSQPMRVTLADVAADAALAVLAEANERGMPASDYDALLQRVKINYTVGVSGLLPHATAHAAFGKKVISALSKAQATDASRGVVPYPSLGTATKNSRRGKLLPAIEAAIGDLREPAPLPAMGELSLSIYSEAEHQRMLDMVIARFDD